MTPAGKIIDIDAFKRKESGLKTTRLLPPRERDWAREYGPTAAIFVLLVVALTFLVSPPAKIVVPVYSIGSISPSNIKAQEDLLVEDKESTQKNRKEAYDSALDIYDFDSGREAAAAERVKNAFSLVARGYRAFSEQAYLEILQERERIESETDMGIRPGPAETSQAAKRMAEFEKSPAFATLMEEFKKTLGVTLDEKSLGTLRYYHFWPRIEEAILSAVRFPLAKGLVPSKNLMPPSSARGILARNIATGAEKPLRNIGDIMDSNDAEQHARESIAAAIPGNKANLRRVAQKIAVELLRPNLTYNGKETLAAREGAAARANPVYFQILRGEIIVREGERITPAHHARMTGLAAHQKDGGRLGAVAGAALVCALLMALGALFVHRNHEEVRDSAKMQGLMALLLAGHMTLLGASQYVWGIMFYKAQDTEYQYLILAAPIVFGPLLVSMLFSAELVILFTVVASALTGIMFRDYPLIAILTLTGGLMCAYHVRQYTKRTAILKVGLMVGLFNALAITGAELASARSLHAADAYTMALAFAGGMVSAILASGAAPIIESFFPVVSDIRLLELTNMNHPLLRRMIMEAPGTYHHSMMVGNLAEEACKAIGANALLARAGAMFHDIGKMKKSEYFVENQARDLNPHDKLTPSMSALVIASHVKDGLDMAKKHKLLPQISAMIPEHHGTQTIRWFYHKAKQAEDPGREEVREESYKYPGPIPSSKESACVAMADSIEAAARALGEPTPQKLKDLVTGVINDKFVQGQLDNSHLTLHELALIADSFTRTLSGIHHHRIQYPEKDREKEKEKETNGARDNAGSDPKKTQVKNP